MIEWEYSNINLCSIPPRTEAHDLLNDAGKEGWELIGITSNGMAYLKRQFGKSGRRLARPSTGAKSKT